MKKLFILVALVAMLVPAFFVIHKAGGWDSWQGVLPKGTTDSLYYYARIKEVVDGHHLVGNPYVYEHRGTISPAFFLPDIVSALPMLLGLPFNIGILFNVFLWSFIFLALASTLFQLLRMPKWWAFVWSIILYVSAYSFMLRPTVMQIVYPVFLAFLIALLKFLYEPLLRRRVVWLSVVAAATFYTYTYLSYIVFLTFTCIFLWYLFTKRFKELRSLVLSGIYIVLLVVPFGIYTFMQMNGPYYMETFKRIGLVYTHVPSIEALFYGRWVAIGLIALGLLWFLFRSREEGDSERNAFWFSTGLALFAGLFLNVLTGVELTLAVHIGRFVVLWMLMILAALLYEWIILRSPGVNKLKYIVVAIFLLALSVGVVRNIPRGLDFFKFDNRGVKTADIQSIAGPLKWLNENVSEESVIWSDETIGEYIPIMTKHYPMYFHGAELHSMPNQELEERRLSWEGRDFSKFNVKYLIIDRTNDDLETLSFDKALYDDGRFVIVPLPLQ